VFYTSGSTGMPSDELSAVGASLYHSLFGFRAAKLLSGVVPPLPYGFVAAFEHQDYRFPALVEHLQPERDPSRSPLFQVMFALQSAPSLTGDGKEQSLAAFAMGDETAEVRVGPLRLRHVRLPQRIAQFDLTLSMGEVGEGGDSRIAGTLDFNLDLFEPGTAARLAGSFQ